MNFKDYFSKNFETDDRHRIPSLRTHYYLATKEEAMTAISEVLKEMKSINKSFDSDYGEIVVDASDFSGTVTIVNLSFRVCAVDIQVMTYNFLPTAKGKKVIEKFYSKLDSKLRLKSIGG